MNNIKSTAIRLIANAFLYSREKKKDCQGYRFDSAFLTSRGITTIQELSELQKELSNLGWCFNILNFNSYAVIEKSFLAEMTKLGFGRVSEASDIDICTDYENYVFNSIVGKIEKYISKSFSSATIEKDGSINSINIILKLDENKTWIIAINRCYRINEKEGNKMEISILLTKDFGKRKTCLIDCIENPSCCYSAKEACSNIFSLIENPTAIENND